MHDYNFRFYCNGIDLAGLKSRILVLLESFRFDFLIQNELQLIFAIFTHAYL